MPGAERQGSRGRWAGPVAAVIVAALAVVLSRSKPPTPIANPPGTFSFAVLGDAPYSALETRRFQLLLRDLEIQDLSLVLQVGDIFWRPCTDQLYLRSRGWFNALPHPVVYTPGDNEWTDCWEPGSGSFAPRDRLDRIRQIFFEQPMRSLGKEALPLINQSDSEGFTEFVENARWTQQGMTFATVHIVGSMNGMDPFPGRSPADDEAVKRRTEAAAAWLRETFAAAAAADASAVVVAFHGSPGFHLPPGDPSRAAYEPFLTALEEEAGRFARPVLVAHGDDHEYTVDRPFLDRPSGPRLENVTRLEVPGSPDVGWVRVTVTPGSATPFAFTEQVVPRWKVW